MFLRQMIQQLPAEDQRAGAERRVHFMGGDCQQINSPPFNTDRAMSCHLRRIDQQQSAVLVRDPADLPQVVHRSENIGGPTNSNQTDAP